MGRAGRICSIALLLVRFLVLLLVLVLLILLLIRLLVLLLISVFHGKKPPVL